MLSIEDKISALEVLCQASTQRLTDSRRMVYSALLEAGKPVTAYELLEALQSNYTAAKPPTIYRALDFLQKMHVVHRVEASKSYIACCQSSPHRRVQLLVCDDCGKVKELNLPDDVSDIINELAQENDFASENSLIEIHSLCKDCAT